MFLEKLQEWYGKDLKNYSPIYQSKDTCVYLIKLDDEIQFARIFKLGDKLEISINKKIPIIKDNILPTLIDAVMYAIEIQKWL